MFVCVIAKYGPRSSSRSDVSGRHRTHVVKSETVSEYQNYVSNSEQATSASSSSEDVVDGNVASCLSAEQELMLTDIFEVLDCDTADHYDASTSSANSLPAFELKTTISRPLMTVETEIDRSFAGNAPVCSTADFPTIACHAKSESTADISMQTESQGPDRRNKLAEAYYASRLQNQPKKPS